MTRHIAADFGAGSGRIIVGTVTPEGTELDEIHRFQNRQIKLGKNLYWDFPALFEELKTGIKKAVKKYDDIVSIGVDTWGVDFGLLDSQGKLIGNPGCYRDARTSGILEKAFQAMPKADIYAETGNQFMEINTVFQLYSMILSSDPALQIAEKLLFTPDLFNYFLTGVAANEYTIASTSQLYNHHTGGWSGKILEQLGIPAKLMQKIIPSGTVLGTLTKEVCAELGVPPLKVVAVGSHDTASALASIRPEGDDWAFISSGTWSLMGVEIPEPIINEDAMSFDFTNEGTVNGKIRFLKNITGLWLLQNVIKEWEEEGLSCEYSDIISNAGICGFSSVIDVDAPEFNHPSSMKEAIAAHCRNTGQCIPQTQAEFMKCITLSLATKYAEVKEQLETCTGKKINKIYIVGGGSLNTLLNKMTEQLTGARVIPGDVEATAIGNIKVQASAIIKDY